MSCPSYETIALGCACVVKGMKDGPYVHAERFVNFCMKHVMSACFRHKAKKGHAANPRWPLRRNKVEGRFLNWFVLETGEHVPIPVLDAHFAVRAAGQAKSDAIAAAEERLRTARRRAEGEAFLLLHGWVKEGEDQWTAPEELRLWRTLHLGSDPQRYIRTHLGHAVNTQKQEISHDR